MKIQLTLFFAAVALMSVYGQTEDPQVYCGRKLAQAMAMLCYAKYGKRSEYNSVQLSYEPEFSWPWLARGLADRGYRSHAALADRALARDMGVRGKRGIIEDCCLKSCSIDTLSSYC